ncbi:MAG: methyltransferase [Rhodocyclaceae bacterium]|nr:methyltransferase [Rhodocyclaceae bacterium]
MSLRERFLTLQSLLAAHEALWRPAPFRVARPEWCKAFPALREAALGLDDATVDHLSSDPESCRMWLAGHLPVVEALAALCELPALGTREIPAADRRFDWSIPGRKRAQIEAFVAHTPKPDDPVLEWCAGKGHLGRRLAAADGVAVRSLEIDAGLCAEAARLAARANAAQQIVCADALDPASARHLPGHAVLALHACGELHRSLVRSAASPQRARAYCIAPCCYHLGCNDGYHPLCADATLAPDADALRLAVTETVTAPGHVRRRLARDQAWKLGFLALRAAIEGDTPRTFKPVPSTWLGGDFEGFCRAIAAREGLRLPPSVDWAHWLACGARRRDEVRRLELVRHAFRRPLETWLVLDLALAFESAGYRSRLGPFCERALTPRNLLIVAEAG